MRALVVDDLRVLIFPEGWAVDHARSLADAAYLLLHNTYDVVYLDHDMGAEEARHLVAWLQYRYEAGQRIDVGGFYLQTSNAVEKLAMPVTLLKCGYAVYDGWGVARLDQQQTAQRTRAAHELEAAAFPYGRNLIA